MNTEKTKSDAIDIKKTVKKTVDELNELEGDALSKTPEKVVVKTKKKKKKKKKRSKRCLTCNKKVGIVPYTCRCNIEYIFCSKHRLPSKHNCSFDYKNFKKNKIENDNPKIEFDKINKF